MSSRRRETSNRRGGSDLTLFSELAESGATAPEAGEGVLMADGGYGMASGAGASARSVFEEIPGGAPASAVSVVTLTRTAKDVLEGAFTPLWVRGEVSDFKAHRNGHWYFCLRDAEAQIRCVVWARDRRRIPAPPDDGMQVVAFGQLTVYPARGDMQFAITMMEAQGDGLWRKALELTRARLAADGLLDPARKRALPMLPARVAVVTSQDGAALHDIVSVIRRRCPSTEIVLVPAAVQGETAPESLCAALDRVARWGEADVVIIGRGGGAREDLWAFNDERVARAVAACPIPTISAVGHEVDITICDLVADVRAATPSAAAEAAVPVLRDLADALRAHRGALHRVATRQVDLARRRLAECRRDLTEGALGVVERRRQRLELVAGSLNALSPLATLARGYAVAKSATGVTLTRAEAFTVGAPFELILRDGRVHASTREVDLAPQSTEPGTGPAPEHA